MDLRTGFSLLDLRMSEGQMEKLNPESRYAKKERLCEGHDIRETPGDQGSRSFMHPKDFHYVTTLKIVFRSFYHCTTAA